MSVTENSTGTEQAEKGQATPSTPPEKAQAEKQVSSAEPKLYTQVEMEKANKHAADSEAGRVRAEERRTMREERDAMELRALEGQETSVIDAAKARQAATKLKGEADERNTQAEAKEKAANETLAMAEVIKSTAEATKLATKHNIDANVLLGFTTDVTKMEALASILPKVDPNAPAAPEINPDSGESAGGGGDDATFLKGFGNGDLPYTKENRERAERLTK